MATDTPTKACAPGTDPQHGYCGRKSTTISTHHATCKDCAAAIRADQHAGLALAHHTERTNR